MWKILGEGPHPQWNSQFLPHTGWQLSFQEKPFGQGFRAGTVLGEGRGGRAGRLLGDHQPTPAPRSAQLSCLQATPVTAHPVSATGPGFSNQKSKDWCPQQRPPTSVPRKVPVGVPRNLPQNWSFSKAPQPSPSPVPGHSGSRGVGEDPWEPNSAQDWVQETGIAVVEGGGPLKLDPR